MRKILGFVACSLLAFSLGFTLLPASFGLLTGWLGPLFGTSIHVLLATIFILFGDPLRYASLIGLWVTTGFICGLIIRKRLGSVSTASSVFSTMFVVLIVSGLRMFEILESIGFVNLLSVLPPLPPGSTLGTIFSAPIISDVYGIWQKVTPQALQSPTEVLSPLIGVLIFNLVKNVSLIILSALAGCETGKLVERLFLARRKPKSGAGESTTDAAGSGKSSNLSAHSYSALILLVSILTVSLVFPALGNPNDNPYYTEAVFGFVTPDGTAYLASLFVDSDVAFANIDLSASEFENAVVGILISQDTSLDSLPPILTSPSLLGGLIPMDVSQSLLENLTSYYELIPRTLFVTVYFGGDANVTRQKADSAASAFSRAFGASLGYLASFAQEVEIGGTRHNIAFFVYQSDTPLSDISPNIMGYLPIQRDGLANLSYAAYESGMFTPRKTGVSANGTVMMAGFFSSSTILDMLETAGFEELEPLRAILPSSTTPTPMLCVFSYWTGKLHSSPLVHQFNINDLLGNMEPIRFSPEATVSLILTAVPNATVQDGKVVSQQPLVNVITSIDVEKPEFRQAFEAIQALNQTGFLTFISVEKGSQIPWEDLTVNFVQVLPLNVKIEKTITAKELDIGQVVDVTVSVINKDEDDTAENVTLDDRLLLEYYSPLSIQLVQGSLTHTWSEIPADSSVTHTYSILLKKEGIYTFPSAQVTYSNMGNPYVARSNYVYVRVKSPPLPNLLISGVPSAWGILARALDKIPGLSGKGPLILSCITIAILGVLSFMEYRNYRKWVKKRKASPQSTTS